jgi:Mg2+/Co2+ transporter CorB
MTANDWLAIVAIAVCLLLSAVFAAGETALTAVSRARMLRLEKHGNRAAALVNTLLGAREHTLGAIMLANYATTIVAASLAAGICLIWFGNLGILCAIVVVTGLVLVFAQALPKMVANNAPDRIALAVARPVTWTVTAVDPVLRGAESLARGILKLAGTRTRPGQALLPPHAEARGTVDGTHREGWTEKPERELPRGMLDLRELEVSDVMIHRTKMVTVRADDPPETIVSAVLEAPVTRLPVWRGSPENIVGILHAKDVLRALHAAEGDRSRVDVDAIMTPPWFVPDTTPLYEQLKVFRRRNTPLALVVDEYGVMLGLVTIEDILEEIVGDITDERDVDVPGVRPQPDGSVNVDGGVPIRDLNRAMDWHLPDGEATTIAGLVIHESQSIPEPGQSFTFHGFRFRVLRRSRNRITALRITPVAVPHTPSAAKAG